ncbi:type I restriction endonuclease [Limnofasciculus baicalensis]|uniref:Type I restriction enzyme HsdR N-terminal domain-containing protein n=1 Tax=Limnofasciculus baicalensis BBK-W-15 TaxID=2699891 RepID=A0AAE3KNC7_9CYAN|nr:type I restriction endonuclease [Limnofasciculus baicalensis]MCP2730380.1 type I restriction enzyme HsdR N-terminal domain-containing protein [Limnofasciculus baicalensis BBK-W-15]
MARVLTITEAIKTLGQIEAKLGIRLSEDSSFFTEWLGTLPELSGGDRDRLDRVRHNYLYQSGDGILLEETIKMVILSPLLELAGFYQAPYKFRAEVSVEVEAIGDGDEVLRGRIDALVVQNRLWVVLIEAKKATFDLELALPQTLAYMAGNPELEKPLFGLITNGSSYLFVKLLGKEYGVSDLFGTRSQHRNNLCEVLKILRHLGSLVAA